MQDEFKTRHLTDFLRGVALGDTLGMLAENLPRRTVARLHRKGVGQEMPFGRGFLSDETEQAILTARALCRTNKYLPMRVSFRRELLWWLSTLPIGAGSSTVRACLSIAFKSRLSLTTTLAPGGSSKGNGPLLRAATIGLLLEAREIHGAAAWTTLLTHTSLEAVMSSVITARIFSRLSPPGTDAADRPGIDTDLFREAAQYAGTHISISHSDYGWHRDIRQFVAGLDEAFATIDMAAHGNISTEEGLERLGSGQGVSGHATRTLMAALLIAATHRDDVNAAADTAILAGGDTDSVAALACGLVATASRIPQDYSRLKLWRDPYGLTSSTPLSGNSLLRALASRRHRFGMLAEHLALMFLVGPYFLARRAFARWGW
ncbi:hypothetical protein G6L37_01105 [Agrobacterium rubi]|nr:hypothetical protein [Agrobacterium rubi]NTF23989.1 hypothetical protein [Agrobacterium rubi]